MLNDEQHSQLKYLLKAAMEGDHYYERRIALEDAAKIVGVTLDQGFCGEHHMKAGKNRMRATDQDLKDATKPNPSAFIENQAKW